MKISLFFGGSPMFLLKSINIFFLDIFLLNYCLLGKTILKFVSFQLKFQKIFYLFQFQFQDNINWYLFRCSSYRSHNWNNDWRIEFASFIFNSKYIGSHSDPFICCTDQNFTGYDQRENASDIGRHYKSPISRNVSK